MCEFDEDLIRSFEEFDEKLPFVAKVIVRRGIDFARLNEVEEIDPHDEANCEIVQSICSIFRETVECTSEMTADEFEHYFDMLLIACELVVMVSDGTAYEKDGKFVLAEEA